MENQEELEEQLPQEEGYQPRSPRQVWAARVGLVLFLLFVAYQILQIAGGWQ